MRLKLKCLCSLTAKMTSASTCSSYSAGWLSLPWLFRCVRLAWKWQNAYSSSFFQFLWTHSATSCFIKSIWFNFTALGTSDFLFIQVQEVADQHEGASPFLVSLLNSKKISDNDGAHPFLALVPILHAVAADDRLGPYRPHRLLCKMMKNPHNSKKNSSCSGWSSLFPTASGAFRTTPSSTCAPPVCRCTMCWEGWGAWFYSSKLTWLS